MDTKNCICKCEGCGELFKPKKADRLRFCSRDCAFKNIHLIRNNPLKKEKESLKRISKAKHTTIKSIFVLKEIAALIRIKDKNKRQYGTLNKKTYNHCQCCFNLFVFTIKMGMHQTLCSDCKKKKKKERQKKDRNIRKHKGRAEKHGAKYEPIDPIKVFDRDKWKCHLCGIKTPKTKRGKNECNSPELDHIITFAEGGSHTYNNVACCCRKCNQQKSSKSKGQLFLIG